MTMVDDFGTKIEKYVNPSEDLFFLELTMIQSEISSPSENLRQFFLTYP